MSSRTVPRGGAVTITADYYWAFGAVTETLPAGFGYVSSDRDDEEVQATGQWVRFTMQGDSPSPDIVNAPSKAGQRTTWSRSIADRSF